MPRKPDTSIIGKVFNDLRVEELTDERNSYGRLLYRCTCLLCRKTRMATKSNLIRGEVKNCGNHPVYTDISNRTFGKLTALYAIDKKQEKAEEKYGIADVNAEKNVMCHMEV